MITESEYVQSQEDTRKKVPPDKYYAILVKKHWDVEENKMVVGRWTDGEMRHKKIYQTGLILRMLNKDITPNIMLYAIVDILLKYYTLKNADGTVKFTRKYVADLVKRIMRANIREMKEIKHSSYKVSDRYCKENNVTKMKVVGELNGEQSRLRKEERFWDIDWFYDASLTWSNGKKITQKQWVQILEENGVMISVETFKRYLDERGYTKKRVKCTTGDDALERDEECEPLTGPNRQFVVIIEEIHASEKFKQRWLGNLYDFAQPS